MNKLAITIITFLFTAIQIFGQTATCEPLLFVYSLHGQTRKYDTNFEFKNDTLRISWGIERNTKWHSGDFIILPSAIKEGNELSYMQPVDKNSVTLKANQTFGIISRKAYKELKDKKQFIYNGVKYKITPTAEIISALHPLIHVTDSIEGAEMWILDNPALPIIWKMKNNPVEIDWEVKSNKEQLFSIAEELKIMPEKSGSTYYAYNYLQWPTTPTPKGYKPFYISHYGRHGSRWIPTEDRYTAVINLFEKENLTTLGSSVRDRLRKVYADAKGNAGMLTRIGEEQHADIAQRMYDMYPEVFMNNNKIYAYSSIVPRCIKSMNSFTHSLLSKNERLRITTNSDKKNMSFIAYDTPQMEQLNAKTAIWRIDFEKFERNHIKPSRLIESLFVNPSNIDNPTELMMGLYWIASNMQDTTTGLTFYDIFTNEELYNIWQSVNYRMYVCNGASPLNGGVPAKSASTLLENIIHSADRAIKNGKESATLRFGHDTNLMRLLTLIGFKDFTAEEVNSDNFCNIWQDYRLAPMAANLQIIFYKNSENKILTKFLHNEKEMSLPINSDVAPYYDWDSVHTYLITQLKKPNVTTSHIPTH